MNKVEFIKHMHAYNAQEMNRAQTERALDAFIETLKDALAQGETVHISGLGTFKVANRAARTGRNPQTGEAIQIAAKKAPTFSPSKALKEAVR